MTPWRTANPQMLRNATAEATVLIQDRNPTWNFLLKISIGNVYRYRTRGKVIVYRPSRILDLSYVDIIWLLNG